MAMFENNSHHPPSNAYIYHAHALNYNPYAAQAPYQNHPNLFDSGGPPLATDDGGLTHYNQDQRSYQRHSPRLFTRTFGDDQDDVEDQSSVYASQYPAHQSHRYDSSRSSTPSTISSGSSIDSQSTEDGLFPRLHNFEDPTGSAPYADHSVQYFDAGIAPPASSQHVPGEYIDIPLVQEDRDGTDWSILETEEQIEKATELVLRRTLDIPPDKRVDLYAIPDKGKDSRPDISLPSMIKLAIFGSEAKRLSLGEIYEAIEERFEYYRQGKKAAWRNSVRHTLSLKMAFRRQERNSDDKGKGSYWLLDLANGDGNKRDRRRHSRKSHAVCDDADDDNDSGRSDFALEEFEEDAESKALEKDGKRQPAGKRGLNRTSLQKRPSHLALGPYSTSQSPSSAIRGRQRSGSHSSALSIRSRSGSTSSPLNPNIARTSSFADIVHSMGQSPIPSPSLHQLGLPSSPFYGSPYGSPYGQSLRLPSLESPDAPFEKEISPDSLHSISSSISALQMDAIDTKLIFRNVTHQ